ncbi:glycosyltransferase family 2 protein [Candidatus Borrarchaeum sp.]|uniref:glycosyltransferase family 2 protein n=1 Tax=Candidatus Borrarchaeum sp. TaxID=2846742 RepID=UPI00257C13EE|nr:glycosyltransferase family 2 protein [Candidatus Borrarchaeum sp.]
MYKENKVLLMMPAYNEEGKIGKVLSKVPRELVDEILVINDGSTDNTVDEAKRYNVTIISLKQNKGLGIAFKIAFAYIKKKGFDIGVIMGSDGQDDPRRIETFLQGIVDDDFDMIQGCRYLVTVKNIPLFRLVTTRLYSIVFSIVAKKWIRDASTGYKAFKVALLDKIDFSAEWLNAKYGIEQHFLIQTIKKGYKVKEIPAKKHFPKIGYSKMRPLVDWLNMLRPIFKNLW